MSEDRVTREEHMPTHRPIGVRILIYANLLYSLFACCLWGSHAAVGTVSSHSRPSQILYSIPEYREYVDTQAWCGAIMSFVLVLGSYWLLEGWRGGRHLCILYSGFMIAAQLLGVFVSFYYVQPALAQYELEHGMPAGSIGQRPGTLFVWLVILAHAVILLVVMLRYDEAAYLEDLSLK